MDLFVVDIGLNRLLAKFKKAIKKHFCWIFIVFIATFQILFISYFWEMLKSLIICYWSIPLFILFFIFPSYFLIYFYTMKYKGYELSSRKSLVIWKHLLNQFFLITDANESNDNKTNAILEIKKFYISNSSPFAAHAHFLLKIILKEFWNNNLSIIAKGNISIQDVHPNINVIYEIINKKSKQKDDKKCIFSTKNFSLENFYLNVINFNRAELKFSNMHKAHLAYATFIEADLSEANLTGASLVQADFESAKLIHADLSDADLSDAKLEKADLMLANLEKTDLHKANLKDANIFMVNLQEARLTDADLTEVDLGGSDLQKADLSGANLTGASLIKANLSGAKLDGTILSKAIYSTYKEFETIFPKGFDPQKAGMIMPKYDLEGDPDCLTDVGGIRRRGADVTLDRRPRRSRRGTDGAHRRSAQTEPTDGAIHER